jgi:hypothetical protein
MFIYHDTKAGYIDKFCLMKLNWKSHSIIELRIIFPIKHIELSNSVEKIIE